MVQVEGFAVTTAVSPRVSPYMSYTGSYGTPTSRVINPRTERWDRWYFRSFELKHINPGCDWHFSEGVESKIKTKLHQLHDIQTKKSSFKVLWLSSFVVTFVS